jgi:cyclic pyranopterin phosphate synthase
MKDSLGRNIDYMRVALTDRCNLKCWYCTGREDFQFLPPEKTLSYEELLRLLHIAVEKLGIIKLRLTGGEPLLYEHLEELVCELRKMPSLQFLTITTNGIALKQRAFMLRHAGIDRINVSLEGATEQAYISNTGSACLKTVLEGLEAVLQAGFEKPKLNVVLCRQFETEELSQLLAIGHRYAGEIRFIELMGFNDQNYPNIDSMLQAFTHFGKLTRLSGAGTATHRYTIDGYDVILGMIPSKTHPFCTNCSRIRLASDGQLRTCLYTHEGVQLRPMLRNGCSDHDLEQAMRDAIFNKPQSAVDSKLKMCRVGG